MRVPTPTDWLWILVSGWLLALVLVVATPAHAAEIQADGRVVDPVAYVAQLDPQDEFTAPSGCLKYASLIAKHFPANQRSKAVSVCQCESGGNPNAVSRTNDHGLFQHNANSNPGIRFTSVGYTWSDRYDPEANIAAAAWLWRQSGWKPWVCNRYTNSNTYSDAVIGETIDVIAGGDEGLNVEVSPIRLSD